MEKEILWLTFNSEEDLNTNCALAMKLLTQTSHRTCEATQLMYGRLSPRGAVVIVVPLCCLILPGTHYRRSIPIQCQLVLHALRCIDGNRDVLLSSHGVVCWFSSFSNRHSQP
jgi:hypothetical protein